MGIYADVQQLEVSAKIDLFELDCEGIGGDKLLFHGYTRVGAMWWQGVEYEAWPILGDGFGVSGEAQQPTPSLKVGNVEGSIGALAIFLDDLIGAKLTRKRTLGKYLDARNFPDGNPTADPEQAFVDDIWYINQKTQHDNVSLTFELKSALDLSGVFLPKRLIVANVCAFRYRSAECGYTGTNYFDKNDVATGDPGQDVCGKRLSSCKLRFGANEPLSFGSFPSASLIRG